MVHVKNTVSETDFLNQILYQAPGFVVVFLGRKHRCVFMNKGVASMLFESDAVGKPLNEIVSPFVETQIASRLNQVWRTGKSIMAEALPYRVYDDDKHGFTVRYGDFLYHPIKNPQDKIIGVYVQGVDVTDRKLTQENLSFLKKQSISLIRDMIVMTKSSIDQVFETADNFDLLDDEVHACFERLVQMHMSFMNNTNRSLNTVITNAILVMMPDGQDVKMRGQAVELNSNYQSLLAILIQDMARIAVNRQISAQEIQISWEKRDENMLRFIWHEQARKINDTLCPKLNDEVVKRFNALNSKNKIQIMMRAGRVKYIVDLCLDDI